MEEKERVIMGKLSETAAATMVKRDDTMFRFGFWGQVGAPLRAWLCRPHHRAAVSDSLECVSDTSGRLFFRL